MVLNILKYGEKILREKSVVVPAVDEDLRALADDMLETMHNAGGVGLAAQQVGRLESLCVIDIPEGCEDDDAAIFNAPVKMPLKLFNPEILVQDGSRREKEGCLSFPGVGGSLTRAEMVTVGYVDEDNKPQMISAKGFLSRALQHEIDHLNGVLYVDRMSAVERLSMAPKLKRLAKQNGGVR